MVARKTSRKKKIEENSSFNKEFEVPWYIWAIGVLVILFFVFYFVFSGVGKINYKGLVFEAEKYGQTIIYHYSYFYSNPGGEVTKYNLYVHTNPKKNNILFNASIVYPGYQQNIKLSINTTGLTNCSNSNIALGELSQFLISNAFNISVGTTNASIATQNNLTYIDCETYPNYFTIYIGAGNETRVVQQGNCFRIEANNCEILESIEKFMVESVAQARERAKNS